MPDQSRSDVGRRRHRSPALALSPRLARTVSRARWKEYCRLLASASSRGYAIVSLEDWIEEPTPRDMPTLILRHDVDQHPRSAILMARIERHRGVTSTWYFRWRTADTKVIGWLRQHGFSVGLHYETLTRAALEAPFDPPTDDDRLAEARDTLRREIAAFQQLFGPIRSVCPHGDSRIPAVSNAVLLRGEDVAAYDIDFDGNDAMRGRRLGCWLTDRSSPDGSWKQGTDPESLLAQGVTPILCLTHPNNWVSGPSLWLDRLLAAILPSKRPDQRARLVRTRGDAPPPPSSSPAS